MENPTESGNCTAIRVDKFRALTMAFDGEKRE